MITFIISHPHDYTVAALRGEILAPLVPATGAMTYDQLFAADRLPPGTYVFADLERLHPVELRLAARYFRRLAALPGFRVLNDPARVKTRYALIRALAEAGINDFDAYWADGLPRPRRFPVFLRHAADHGGPIGDLIGDQAELDARLRALAAEGMPVAGMLVVEFCGERNARGFHEKLAFLKIGERIALSSMLLGEHWCVKLGGANLAAVPPEVMRDQLEAMRGNRHAEALRAAFDVAGIDYGRADVGLRGGRLQVYEINTNPHHAVSDRFTSEEHRQSRRIFRERLGAMLHAIDAPGGGEAVAVDPGPFDEAAHLRRELARTLAAPSKARRRPLLGRWWRRSPAA